MHRTRFARRTKRLVYCDCRRESTPLPHAYSLQFKWKQYVLFIIFLGFYFLFLTILWVCSFLFCFFVPKQLVKNTNKLLLGYEINGSYYYTTWQSNAIDESWTSTPKRCFSRCFFDLIIELSCVFFSNEYRLLLLWISLRSSLKISMCSRLMSRIRWAKRRRSRRRRTRLTRWSQRSPTSTTWTSVVRWEKQRHHEQHQLRIRRSRWKKKKNRITMRLKKIVLYFVFVFVVFLGCCKGWNWWIGVTTCRIEITLKKINCLQLKPNRIESNRSRFFPTSFAKENDCCFFIVFVIWFLHL